ncbi:MAG TPA: L,D-transpeptidase/peptidoglycan binding protein [Gaiellaceae bacterium]|nr:L,D-transpeptidase/peptidoglycan binding protein [Gaiellaceae bacterium]
MRRFLLFVILALVACGAAAPSAQRTAYVPPGVAIGGVRVGGLTSEQARNAISWWYNRPLRFVFSGKHWTVRPAALGASVDTDDAVQQALKGRRIDHLSLRVKVDPAQIQRYVRALHGRLSIEPQDATATLKGLRPVIVPGKTGLELDRAKTVRRIEAALAVARRPVLQPIARTVAPSLTSSDFGAVVVIYRGSNELHLYRGAQPWRTLQVATGQAIYPTPVGDWHVVDMQRNPWWRPPDSDWAKGLKPIPPGPGNPLGTRWMGLDAAGVGMHGTPDAASIGYSASHGCIRMRIADAEWLFAHVRIGTPVFIVDA